VSVDTTHFKGNSPGWVSLDISEDATAWSEIVERVAVDPDTRNEIGLPEAAHATYLRLSIHPDGGVARFRVMGRPDPEAASRARLAYLNSLFDEAARGFFLTACVAPRWVDAMVSGRAFSSVEDVFARMQVAFAGLGESDWLQAFAAHPRIGERGDATANKEQTGTASASREMLNDLVDVNRRYEGKFGFTYIVYATGKSAAEMLEIARGRLGNDRPTEIAAAAAEQRKITAAADDASHNHNSPHPVRAILSTRAIGGSTPAQATDRIAAFVKPRRRTWSSEPVIEA
jgi:allantoicase